MGTTMTRELIARLEAAQEGSRELDAEIWQATNNLRDNPLFWNWRGLQPKSGTAEEMLQEYALRRAPGFTRSIDAALTLVPEGYWLTLDRYVLTMDEAPNQREWRVWLKKLCGDIEGDGPSWLDKKFATAPTPALALCIAALRALDGER